MLQVWTLPSTGGGGGGGGGGEGKGDDEGDGGDDVPELVSSQPCKDQLLCGCAFVEDGEGVAVVAYDRTSMSILQR